MADTEFTIEVDRLGDWDSERIEGAYNRLTSISTGLRFDPDIDEHLSDPTALNALKTRYFRAQCEIRSLATTGDRLELQARLRDRTRSRDGPLNMLHLLASKAEADIQKIGDGVYEAFLNIALRGRKATRILKIKNENRLQLNRACDNIGLKRKFIRRTYGDGGCLTAVGLTDRAVNRIVEEEKDGRIDKELKDRRERRRAEIEAENNYAQAAAHDCPIRLDIVIEGQECDQCSQGKSRNTRLKSHSLSSDKVEDIWGSDVPDLILKPAIIRGRNEYRKSPEL